MRAGYRVPSRAMMLDLKIRNGSGSTVRIGEFAAAGVHFFNQAVALQATGAAGDIKAAEGLSLDKNTPIQPGEEGLITLKAGDALWESERLDGVINDPDSRIGRQRQALYFRHRRRRYLEIRLI